MFLKSNGGQANKAYRVYRGSSRRFSDSVNHLVNQDLTSFPIVTRQLVALAICQIAEQQLCLIPRAHLVYLKWDYDRKTAPIRAESIYRGSVSPDFDGWLIFFVILQAALYALEDGGMSVDRVENKHFMAALSTIRPSLTTAQLEKFKLVQR